MKAEQELLTAIQACKESRTPSINSFDSEQLVTAVAEFLEVTSLQASWNQAK